MARERKPLSLAAFLGALQVPGSLINVLIATPFLETVKAIIHHQTVHILQPHLLRHIAPLRLIVQRSRADIIKQLAIHKRIMAHGQQSLTIPYIQTQHGELSRHAHIAHKLYHNQYSANRLIVSQHTNRRAIVSQHIQRRQRVM